MNAKAFAIAILCFAAPISANAQDTCKFLEEDPASCNHFVGCINKNEDAIFGTSRGWDDGTLFGEKISGATCSGTWEFDALIGKGKGAFECSDGDSANNLNFFARGETIPAMTAVAITKNGNRLQMWTSPDLSIFFKEQFPDAPVPGQYFKCGDAWIELPTEFPELPASSD